MRRSDLVAAAGCLALALPPAPGVAQRAELADVLARHAEAMGCADGVPETGALRLTGTYVYNSGERPLEILLDREGRVRMSIDGGQRETTDFGVWDSLDGELGEEFVRVLDGDDGWFVSESNGQGGGLEDLEVVQLRDALEVEGPLCGLTEKGHRASLEGSTTVEGRSALHLRLARADGRSESWYLDAATALPIRREVELGDDPKFYEPRIWVFDDYRPVAGLQLPHYVMAEEEIFSRELLIDLIEADVTMDATWFRRAD